MKLTIVFALTSLLFLGITSQVQAANHQSTAFLELENQKYMMSAHLKNNKGSDPSRGSGRRNFVENPTVNSENNSIFFGRGSGR
ncbi:heterocyst-inhibiting protein PatX [Lyngbya sp. PCC 8106]|uniref:heterocyst-inhibiting protein PatX n=1 Tax=Lyngbya sp. (strain PCC 8106) TaxID=313612 RepID=UPI0000EAA02B|nr:hypothetical protein [Lyngbya sp. PCC 8106]EAW34553.1 hypothetical protein L8106_14050 [Lyngbya sp. PCC 8106]